LAAAGLKINATKSTFCCDELEYLGYLINRQGVRPTIKKVDAIRQIATPKTKKQVRSFIGMVNYYRDMWPMRSHLLAPLSALTSTTAVWKWTDEHQKAFDTMKVIIAKETLLTYPDFNKVFEIHTDASKLQLGACISQEGKPIAFYSRKLNSAQTKYTTTERELLSIVETLKEFRNILLGQQVLVHTDHANLTAKQFNCDRVMRWRLYIEEYPPQTFATSREPKMLLLMLSAGWEKMTSQRRTLKNSFIPLHMHLTQKQMTLPGILFPMLTLTPLNKKIPRSNNISKLINIRLQILLGEENPGLLFVIMERL
jgi:hypothetical protein